MLGAKGSRKYVVRRLALRVVSQEMILLIALLALTLVNVQETTSIVAKAIAEKHFAIMTKTLGI